MEKTKAQFESRKNALSKWIFTISIFLFWVSLYLYVPILPVYATFRGASLKMSGLVVASYGLTQLILRIPIGLSSDRLRERKNFVIGGWAMVLISGLGLSLVLKPSGLVLFRAVSGIAASTWVVMSVLFASFFKADKAVKATGLAVFLTALGQVVGTSLGGIFAEHYGWLAPFYASAILAFIGLITVSAIRINDESMTNQPANINDIKQIFSNRNLLLVSSAAAVSQYAMYATSYGFVPIYAAQLGASKITLGWLTSIMQLVYMFASMYVGFKISGNNEKLIMWLGLLLITLASLGLFFSRSIEIIFLTRILHGIGHGLSFPVLMGLAIKNISGNQRATAMGVFQAVYAIGMFTGPALSGFVAESFGILMVFLSTAIFMIIMMLLLWKGYNKIQQGISYQNLPTK